MRLPHLGLSTTVALLIVLSPCAALMTVQFGAVQDEPLKMVQAEMSGQCAGCHKTIDDEWKTSAHAKAYAAGNFPNVAATVTNRESRCDSCHAPGLLQQSGIGKMPVFRGQQHGPQRGVMCVCCHMDAQGAMHGPYDGLSPFHKTVKDQHYQASNAVCISCHGQTVGAGPEFNQQESFLIFAKELPKASCLDCHMRPVEREPALGAPKRMCGPHTWHGAYDEHMVKSAATLRLRVAATTATVTVSNSVGHLLPGGAFRQAVLEISANGQVVKKEVFQREVGGKVDTRLLPNERRRVAAEVAAGAKVEAKLWWKLMPDTPDQQRMLMTEASM